MPLLRHALMLAATLALGAGVLHAQSTFSPHSADSADSATALDSSSLDGMPAALIDSSAASSAEGSGGGAQESGRYGRYRSRDTFSHLTFMVGAGANGPTPDTSNDITWGGNFTVGAGYRFNPMFSTLVEYQYISDKLPGRLINEAGSTGGNAHIWSFTLAPVVNLMPKSKNSIYVTGGGGFYRKVTNFTDPEPATYCTYFYCGIDYVDTVVGHYSSNQGGWNIGAGFQHKFGFYASDSRAALFAEARYLRVLSPAVTTQANGLGTTTVGENTNLVPITLGLRW